MSTPKPSLAVIAAAAVAMAATSIGCSVVPKSRLDAATKVVKELREKQSQQQDSLLSLKGENADLTQRSFDDSRKIAALEAANGRLEVSVQGYIDERENLNDAFLRFKRLAQASAASPPSTAMISRLRSFSTAHAGTTFDPTAASVLVEADRLFLPGTDRLRPEAGRWLDDFATILMEPEAKAWPLVVAGRATDSPVKLASTGPETAPGDLALARAVKIRAALAERLHRDPSRIGVASLGVARPSLDDQDDRTAAPGARIELQLAPATPAAR